MTTSMNTMRDQELHNRRYGDLDMADLCREAADARDRGDRLSQRMALSRIVHHYDDKEHGLKVRDAAIKAARILRDDVGPCTACGHVEPRAPHRDQGLLCYDCWHTAREREQCWRVRRVPVEDVPDFVTSGAYVEEEAREFADELNQRHRDSAQRFEPIPWPRWEGDRIGHPGYLKNRVRQVHASLSKEDFAKWCDAMGDSIKYWRQR